MNTYIGPIKGFRAWTVKKHNNNYRIGSLIDAFMWEGEGFVQAFCSSIRKHKDIPNPHCSCGIYAIDAETNFIMKDYNKYLLLDIFKNYIGLETNMFFSKSIMGLDRIVFGEVLLWGKVIKHEMGFRAEYAWPSKIYLFGWDNKNCPAINGCSGEEDEKIIKDLTSFYGCEVVYKKLKCDCAKLYNKSNYGLHFATKDDQLQYKETTSQDVIHVFFITERAKNFEDQENRQPFKDIYFIQINGLDLGAGKYTYILVHDLLLAETSTPKDNSIFTVNPELVGGTCPAIMDDTFKYLVCDAFLLVIN